MLNDNNELTLLKEILSKTKSKTFTYDIWLKPRLVMKYTKEIHAQAFDVIYKKILGKISHKHDYRVKDALKIIFYNFLNVELDKEKYHKGKNILSLIIPMNKSYYVSSGLRTNIPSLVSKLVEHQYIERINDPWFNKNDSSGQCSKFIALEKMYFLINEYKDALVDTPIALDEEIETVRLNKTVGKKKVLVKYNDTPSIIKMKQRMQLYNEIYKDMDITLDNEEQVEEIINSKKINAFMKLYNRMKNGIELKTILNMAKEECETDIKEGWYQYIQERLEEIVDKYNIKMPDFSRWYYYRVFNQDFKHGGRLCGHWILSCPSEIQDHILIDDMKTVNLDIASCHCSIAAAFEGIQLDYNKDFYDIGLKNISVFKDKDGFYTGKRILTWKENKQEMRDFIKLAVLTMINAKDQSNYIAGICSKGLYGCDAHEVLN